MAETLPIERLTRVAPLGLRFWDAATGLYISDGLTAGAVPKLAVGTYGGPPVQAFANRSGVFVFHHLPGLSESEFGSGDLEYWQAPPAKKDFIVTVSDGLNRFLPFSFSVQAPTRKILVFACLNGKPSPLPDRQPAGSLPLYSASGRPVPGGCAVIRAQLARSPAAPRPAAWAVVEAYVKNIFISRGIADPNGRVALYFPYPKIVLPNPVGNRPPLTQATWPVDIKVFSSLSPPVPSSPGGLPDLCEVYAQPAASPLRQVGPDLPLQTQDLLYGQEFIFKTANHSELFLG
jgi:hypothetical protein